MAAQSGPYSSFYEKLQLPHPLVQRFAVKAIFQRLKDGPPHSNLSSTIGREAFSRCLTSTQPAVLDQTVKEICSLCRDGKLSVEQGLQELQSALDAVAVESVASVVNGIGFLCRLFIHNVQEGTQFTDKTGDLLGVGFHPLVKSFQTRTEGHQHILQQVKIILIQAIPRKQITTLQFLQPFITSVLLQSSVSCSHLLFARDLHCQLAVITLSCYGLGRLLLKILIDYVQHYRIESAEDREVAMAACKELVDIWENHIKQTDAQQIKVKELEKLGCQLLCRLIGLCHELLSHKVSFYNPLILVRRVMKSLKVLSSDIAGVVGVHMMSMAHMLAIVDSEQDQLLLLDLGLGWLEEVHTEGRKSRSGVTIPALLVWVFPVLHVMSYPSVAVKLASLKLLQALEKFVEDAWEFCNTTSMNDVGPTLDDWSWGEQHAGVAVCRLLQLLWSEKTISGKWLCNPVPVTMSKLSSGEDWLRNLSMYMRRTSHDGQEVFPISHSLGQNRGLLISLSTLVTVFLMHPNAKLALEATEALASIGKVVPIWGVSLVPAVLFCLRFRGKSEKLAGPDIQLGLLKAFPSLACHSATLPLVLQVLQPMLNTHCDLVVQATAVRLLCKTWEFTDRAFPYLQKVLRPEDIHKKLGGNELLQSRAACIRDVSEKDPDRGVDLVLSIQACIESTDSIVLSLGLQSLALLCKEDVIDFYTAWLVISKIFHVIPSDPLVLQSLCMLLRYGGLDAAAHPDAAIEVLEILWKAAAMKGKTQIEDSNWKARAMALKGLSSYEMDNLEALCPGKRVKQVELLFSETSAAVLPFCEELLSKALYYEHRERHRGQREAKVSTTKLGKLLKALPEALNSASVSPASGKRVKFISESPGATLSCFYLPAPEKTPSLSKRDFQKVVKTWRSNYEKIYLETAEQQHLSGNLIVAMLSLKSWGTFVSRWLSEMCKINETEDTLSGREENLLKAAKFLSKIFQTSCEDGIPRVAESATFALAALCEVMPTTSHGIAEEVSVFLESRIMQDGHEHMQWSATLALGVVATSLHATDWNRKSEIVKILLKHAGTSDRGIVKGACGLALGITCQSLLRSDGSSESAGAIRRRETETLVQIVLCLVQLTSETCPIAAPAFKTFLGLLRTEIIAKERLSTVQTPEKGPSLEEDDFWAVVGLVWGLGSCVTGLEHLSCPTLVSALTESLTSWISILSQENSKGECFSTHAEEGNISKSFLAAGAVLALSPCVDVSSRLEILGEDVNILLEKLQSLIECATDTEKFAGPEQWPSALFAALYVGAGNVVATCLQDGSHSLKLGTIQCLLDSLQDGVEETNCGTWAQLGATIGLANALGAGAALVIPSKRNQHMQDLYSMSRVQVGGLEQPIISRPLLHATVCEDYVSSIIKKLLGIAKTEQDSRLRSYAGWALAFTNNAYHGTFELEGKHDDMENNLLPDQSGLPLVQSGYHMRGLQDFPEDSCLRLLCTKLINDEQTNAEGQVLPQIIVSILRCLEKSPRLPALDWGGIIRRLFRQNVPSIKYPKEHYLQKVEVLKKCTGERDVRQQCVLFAVVHAEQVPALASFLDELCELSRFGTLEAPLRNLLMHQLFHLQRIFSHMRLKRLLKDLQDYTINPSGSGRSLLEDIEEDDQQRRLFRISLWEGLAPFFGNSNFDHNDKAKEVISCLEECMSVLITLLPTSVWANCETSVSEVGTSCPSGEWSVAIECLAKTRKPWLLQSFEVPVGHLPKTQEEIHSYMRAIFARCELVAAGCLTASDLKICRHWITNHEASDMSGLLVEVAWAVKEVTLEEKREWLLDVLDMAAISAHPTTAFLLMALFASCWSLTALLSPLNPALAIEHLPFTLPSLLSQPGWSSILDSFMYRFTSLLDTWEKVPFVTDNQSFQALNLANEKEAMPVILSILRRTCIGLKRHLPLETRFNLANYCNTITEF